MFTHIHTCIYTHTDKYMCVYVRILMYTNTPCENAAQGTESSSGLKLRRSASGLYH